MKALSKSFTTLQTSVHKANQKLFFQSYPTRPDPLCRPRPSPRNQIANNPRILKNEELQRRVFDDLPFPTVYHTNPELVSRQLRNDPNIPT